MKIGPSGGPRPPREPRKTGETKPPEKPVPPPGADEARARDVAKRHEALTGARPPLTPGAAPRTLGPDRDALATRAQASFAASPAGAARPELKEAVGSVARAVGSALGDWQKTAGFVGIKINGPIASGGRLVGPDVASLVKSSLPDGLPEPVARIGDAVARGVGEAVRAWQETVTVPDLPWYPSLAAHPGPEAANVPNIPTPLRDLAQDTSSMTAASLGDRLAALAPKGDDDDLMGSILRDIGEAVGGTFDTWHGSIKVSNVLGGGVAQGYAPPYVPVGPVVGGDNVATPGHLGA